MNRDKLAYGLLALMIIAAIYRSLSSENSRLFPRGPDEYLLTDEVPPEVKSRLHPWVAGFIGLSDAEANRRLKKRWESIERPSLRALSETLGEFDVRGIVDCDDGGMIYAYRPGSPDEGIGDFFYLPGPMDQDEIRESLKPAKLEENEALSEFLFHFGGLSEDTDSAGQFLYQEKPWPLFTDSWDGQIEGFDQWENSLMLYHARNGCNVLIRPDGRVAWWIMQERYVRPGAPNFDEFIRIFNEHRKQSWPFDPYGIPEPR